MRTINKLQDELDYYKTNWLKYQPKFEKSIQEIDQYIFVNAQLMKVTDLYRNYKIKAKSKHFEMAQIIQRQKHKEKELQ